MITHENEPYLFTSNDCIEALDIIKEVLEKKSKNENVVPVVFNMKTILDSFYSILIPLNTVDLDEQNQILCDMLEMVFLTLANNIALKRGQRVATNEEIKSAMKKYGRVTEG